MQNLGSLLPHGASTASTRNTSERMQQLKSHFLVTKVNSGWLNKLAQQYYARALYQGKATFLC